MINTTSVGYIKTGETFQPLLTDGGQQKKYFVSAPSIEDVRELLRNEVPAGVTVPILFITRQTA